MQHTNFTNQLKVFNFGKHILNTTNQMQIKCYNGEMNVCSKCLSFFPTLKSLLKHSESCTINLAVLYEESSFKIAKIEQLKTKQNLTLISQAFIKSKTVFYEVENYDFFVLYTDEIVGYFSGYKDSVNSLNCLLIFPCFQKQGFGTVLFDFSNIFSTNSVESPKEFAMVESKSPEKPYSKKAILCFRKYWQYKVIGGRTINEIVKRTNLTVNDVIIGLELQGFDFKKWKMTKEVSLKKPRMLSNIVYRLKK